MFKKKSGLRYVLEKGRYFNLELCLCPVLFPKKETERQRRVRQSLLQHHTSNCSSSLSEQVVKHLET